MTDLHFVRHGESLANEADRAGRAGPEDWDALSERGWEQARGLGRRLEGEGIEVIVASTMRRAQETAQGINEVLGLEIETDPDLHELASPTRSTRRARGDFGDTASLNWMPGAPRDFAEPGAESFDAMVARVRRVRERMEARAGDRADPARHPLRLAALLPRRRAVRRRVRPRAPDRPLARRAREHRHQRVPAPPPAHGRDGLLRLGPDHLERPGPPVAGPLLHA